MIFSQRIIQLPVAIQGVSDQIGTHSTYYSTFQHSTFHSCKEVLWSVSLYLVPSYLPTHPNHPTHKRPLALIRKFRPALTHSILLPLLAPGLLIILPTCGSTLSLLSFVVGGQASRPFDGDDLHGGQGPPS